jgi:PKD repeat protein
MTEEERDNNLESLFRNKLEENEMVAESDLTGRFLRRLDRREFLRFNPARFNIYYLFAAAAALTVAGLLLLSSPHDEETVIAQKEQVPENGITVPQNNSDNTKTLQSDNKILKVTDTNTASGTGKAEPAPGGVTERQSGINTGWAGENGIEVKKLGQNDASVARATVPKAVIQASATSGCVPLHVNFLSPESAGCTIEWSFGDGGSSKKSDPDYIYDIPGTYKVTLAITDPRGRKSIATTDIDVWARPVASFEIRQNELLPESDKVLFVNLSAGGVQYLWDFGDGTFSSLSDPSYRYERSGRYDVTLVVYSDNGCADSLTINDAFTDRGTFIRFPNAFMPNTGGPTGGYFNQRTDEDNQVFHPVASGVTAYNLKIYSKMGLLVFESNEIAMGWDGYFKGQICSPGVYIWKVRGTFRNGQPIVMAGDVTLLNY